MTSVPKIGQLFGAPEVAAMFAKWKQAAETGKISYAAIVGIVPPKHFVFDYIGSIEMEDIVPHALDQLKAGIEHAIANRLPPEQDHSLDASYVCYNCCKQALAFDFLIWLVGAEMERVREGAPGPLKVGFWTGKTGQQGLESEYRQKMFLNVVKPSLTLLRAVEDDKGIYGRTRGYRLREIVDAFKAGEAIPRFKPSLHAQAAVDSWFVHDEAPITITLREMDSWPHRNSNIPAWLEFGNYLKSRGEMVIFVRDTAKAIEPLPGFNTCPAASISLDMRCALYARAKANLFVSNGPCTLALFMDKPWLMLSQHKSESEYYPETAEWWEMNGIKAGDGYPWQTPQQQEIFTNQSLEEIMEAWNAFSKVL